MHIVIIGNGVAGIEAAITVRNREPDWDITIISEESDNFFSRTALMWVFSGQLSYQCIEPYERDLYERLNFKRVRARATHLNTETKTITIGDNLSNIQYDRLLIACGSKGRKGPWPGSDLDGIGYFVTMQDLQWFEAEVQNKKTKDSPPNADAHVASSSHDSPYYPRKITRALRGQTPQNPAVVGGGLIGIEAVEVLHAAGLHPRFFIRDEYFWPLALNRDESIWICDRMSEHGVKVHLEESLDSLEGDDKNVISKIKSDKDSYDCDLLVVAIGVVPNTDWLENSGIERIRGGGIFVDSDLKTSATDVWAAGDCAAVQWFDGAVRPEQLWYTSRDQGKLAARAILGDNVNYQRGLWYNSAKLFDIEYTTAGLVNMNVANEQNWYFEEKGAVKSTTRIVMSDDKVVGFNFLGRRWDHEVLLDFVRQRRSLDWVLKNLHLANFDTEFVPKLKLPSKQKGQLTGPARSPIKTPVKPPLV